MTVLELSNTEARKFFMDPKQYGSTDLPPYFDFSPVLHRVESVLPANLPKEILRDASETECVNYTLMGNKDGKYAWRPLQYIHPVLYVDLVHLITMSDNWGLLCSRFKQFAAIDHIKCTSYPVVSEGIRTQRADQILEWWSGFEQESLKVSLAYRHMFMTDISDCYGSIYTHSIAWALHGKSVAKQARGWGLLGNDIDRRIQSMRFGQTNGIPQGSVLMDFIAELVLGYVDEELSRQIEAGKISDYYILRYRDDYRIFVNDTSDGERILKILTTILSELGMRLSTAKTKLSNDIVGDSVKADKQVWMMLEDGYNTQTLEKKMLILYRHATQFPNAGSLMRPLTCMHRELPKLRIENYDQICASLAVMAELTYRNPRICQVGMAIIAELMTRLNQRHRHTVADAILRKFCHLPNTGYLQVWLQRILIPNGIDCSYEEKLCHCVIDPRQSIWLNGWLEERDEWKWFLSEVDVVDRAALRLIKPTISAEEVDVFLQNSERGYQG